MKQKKKKKWKRIGEEMESGVNYNPLEEKYEE